MKSCTVLVAVLALAVVGGCGSTSSKVTEGDRKLLWQNYQGVLLVSEVLTGLMPTLATSSPANVIEGVNASLGALRVVKANQDHMVKTWGEPETKEDFGEAQSIAAREQSKKEHSSSGTLLAVLGAVGGIGTALLGMPWLSKLFPILTGSIGRMAKASLKTMTDIRKEAEKNGGGVNILKILEIAKANNVAERVQDVVSKKAKTMEKELGVDFKHKLPTGAAPAPAPVPAPTPPAPPAAPTT